jgi:hypothetical protein
MGRFLAGSIATMLLIAAGLFWWQGAAEQNAAALVSQPAIAQAPSPPELPEEGDAAARGKAPPMPPSATPKSREARRFDRYDRNRDGTVTRIEMLSTRTAAFRKLDKDHNNLLSFDEWAVRTSERFEGADKDKSGQLTRAEFATTATRPSAATPRCACPDEDEDGAPSGQR